MLDLFGRGYVIEHCVSWLKKDSEEKAFRVYITDTLKAIADNTGRAVKNGVGIKSRFADMVASTQQTESAEIDAEEKANEVKARMKKILANLGKEDG